MPVYKYRSVADMPPSRPLASMKAKNLRLACELSELARAFHPFQLEGGVRKFRSVDEAGRNPRGGQ